MGSVLYISATEKQLVSGNQDQEGDISLSFRERVPIHVVAYHPYRRVTISR